ncbi:response regulator [Natronoglycomyces albus]|uniref:Response regulator transcription factor n=1 Tax=Natronoglycomyces albus TaxID=2811108 RepID=A0A895XP93_9ACTN|nr:response regulator transcription factor [Natronoglycomyces albus]QSB04110.1 response regulator transcription factor [Natronoglycomyces albus]
MITVILADDQVLMRGGFRALIDAEDDMTVLAEAANGNEAVAQARIHQPDLVLMDIEMPEVNGIEAMAEIAADASLSSVRVVMLTNYSFDNYVFQALKAGAAGYLMKDMEPAELLRSIRCAAEGDTLLSPTITRKLIEDYVTRPLAGHETELVKRLTAREKEVATLLSRGLSNSDITEQLRISPATTKTHINRAMNKLGARDRAHLVVIAYETGLVTRSVQRMD